VLAQDAAEELGGPRRIAVGAPLGLGDQLVDDLQLQQVPGGELERIGRLLRLGGVPVEDAGAGLGGDDRIDAVFEHQHAVGDGDGQGAARAPLADDHADHRHAQPAHHLEVHRDGLGLPTLLGADARVSPRRVDEGEHRTAEAVRELHQPARLPVALGAGHPEVPDHVLLGVPALLVPEDHHRPAIEAGPAADDGGILPVGAVSGELEEVGEEQLDVVQEVGPLGMAGQLRHLPAGQVAEDLRLEAPGLLLQLLNLGREVGGPGEGLQLVDLPLQLQKRSLEVQGERGAGHVSALPRVW